MPVNNPPESVKIKGSGGALIDGDATNGLEVDVTRSALPTGAATSANQTNGTQKSIIVDPTGAEMDLFKKDDNFASGGDHGLMILGVSGGTPQKYKPLKVETAGADGESNTNDRLVCEAYLAEFNGTTWDRVRGDITNGLDVDVTRSALPTGAATSANQLPLAAGGHSTYHLVSAASTNAVNIKASAGQVYGWYIYNSNAAARKVAFHNTAGTPTAGSSVFFSIVLPAGAAANVFSRHGIAFSTGIAITTVTGLADSDSTGVAANDLIINVWYT
jgi:hypothetical protein